jgi:hypothetical protein
MPAHVQTKLSDGPREAEVGSLDGRYISESSKDG